MIQGEVQLILEACGSLRVWDKVCHDYGGRGYSPIGHTPEIRPSEKHRDRLNFIASLSAAGYVQFMLYTSSLTVTVFIQFLERLICQQTQKLFWIVDRHPIHRNPKGSAWLTQHVPQIELFYRNYQLALEAILSIQPLLMQQG
jgi:hypothetical protein